MLEILPIRKNKTETHSIHKNNIRKIYNKLLKNNIYINRVRP
jgi:hypothetical protein